MLVGDILITVATSPLKVKGKKGKVVPVLN
jgi:hypothetical protein